METKQSATEKTHKSPVGQWWNQSENQKMPWDKRQ